MVELHVQAKRYLCFAKKGYYQRLSEASRGTLTFQGGMMDAKEAYAFENHPLFRDILRLRAWDERAKLIDGSVLSIVELQKLTHRYWEEQQCV